MKALGLLLITAAILVVFAAAANKWNPGPPALFMALALPVGLGLLNVGKPAPVEITHHRG